MICFSNIHAYKFRFSQQNRIHFKEELYGILHLLTKLVDQDRKIFSSMNPRQELTVLHLYVTTSIKQTIFLFDQPTPTQSIKNLHVVYFSTIMSHDQTWSVKTACKIHE